MAKGSGEAARDRKRAEEACAEHAYLRPVSTPGPLRFAPELRTAAELAGSGQVAETAGALSEAAGLPA